MVIALNIFSLTYAQQCDFCKFKFDYLLNVLKQKKLSQTELQNCWLIVKDLYRARYTDYIDSIANNTSYVSHSLTKTYSEICIKTEGSVSVDYFFKYMTLTEGSAEEERSFSLERLFVKFPEIVLKHIGKNEELLDALTWGFLNNRAYGSNNPFET